MSFSRIKAWIMATRPSSLVISATPVCIATVMAAGDGVVHLPSALTALFGAAMIHIGTNLTNDYWDLKKGSNSIGEIDPMRGIPVGFLKLESIKTACIISFLLVLPPALYLFSRAGWPVAMIAVISVLSGIFYTAGRRPLAYVGLGDIFVLFFFGPVALAGTYYVQSLEINPAILLAGLAPGLFGVGILTINNIRDFEKDSRIDKRTLVVRFGKIFGFLEYLVAIISAFLLPVVIYFVTKDHIYTLLATLTLPFAIPTLTTVLTNSDEDALNAAIGSTIKLLIIYSLLFSAGWIF
jgi:1,4-dihydroxy-2-naphthoate octaprenyltransferase